MPEPTRKAIIENLIASLRSRRERLKMSLNAAAAKASIDRTMWSRVESGERGAGLDILLRMAEALGINLGRFLLRAIKKARR